MYFLHPEILWWLFLVLIPVIIHLFNFRRYKKLYFSNIEFLKDITQQTRKQNKLKHLLVLLLRMLAVALIVLAFAGPRWGEKNEVILSKIKSIYIDNSFSMTGESSKGPAFEVARNIAGELVKTSEKDDRFLIQTNNYQSGKKLLSRQEALDEISKIKITPAIRYFSEVDARQKKLIKGGKGFESFWLSDFQSYAVDLNNFDQDTANNYVFIPIDHVRKKNIYVDTCYFEKPVLLPGQKAKLKVVITNASGEAYDKVPLKLFVNGQLKTVEGIDLTPFKRHETVFTFAPEKSGWQRGKITIEDYPVTFDDELFFSFNVKNRIKILDIYDEQPNPYIVSFYTSDSNFILHRQNVLRLELSRLSQYDVVILDGLTALTSGLISVLNDYLLSGGNVLLAPAGKMDVTSFNRFLSKINAGRFAEPDTVKTRVMDIKKEDAFFKETLQQVPENASLPSVKYHFPYRYSITSGVTGLMSLLNGDYLLARKKTGNGRLFILTAPLDKKATNLMFNPLFVSVLYGIPVSASYRQQLFYYLGTNDKIRVPYVPDNPDGIFELTLEGTGFRFIPGQKQEGNATVLSMYDALEQPGFYQGIYHDSVYFVLAFNYNHLESSMDFLSLSAMDSLLKNSPVKRYLVEKGEINNIAKVINDRQKGTQLWKLFIILALLILLAEVLVLRLWK